MNRVDYYAYRREYSRPSRQQGRVGKMCMDDVRAVLGDPSMKPKPATRVHNAFAHFKSAERNALGL
jgi:hypothetical protein